MKIPNCSKCAKGLLIGNITCFLVIIASFFIFTSVQAGVLLFSDKQGVVKGEKVVISASGPNTTNRISYWQGMVNQHNENGVWMTDPDGRSGADIDKLTYCKKWYSNTVSVEDYGTETITGWKAAGNVGNYTGTKPVYKCKPADVPVAPTGLTAYSVTADSIFWTWNTVDGATSYKIAWSEDYYDSRYYGGVDFTPMSVMTSGPYNFGMSGLKENTSYFFHVKACNSSGCSASTASASAKTPTSVVIPAVPTGLRTESITNSSISWAWTGVSGATSYELYVSKADTNEWVTSISNISSNSRTIDMGLSADTNYQTKVRACNSVGCSGWSSIVTAKTSAKLVAPKVTHSMLGGLSNTNTQYTMKFSIDSNAMVFFYDNDKQIPGSMGNLVPTAYVVGFYEYTFLDLSVGKHIFKIKACHADDLSLCMETSVDYTVIAPTSYKPDLTITSVELVGNPKVGDHFIEGYVTIKNTGSVKAEFKAPAGSTPAYAIPVVSAFIINSTTNLPIALSGPAAGGDSGSIINPGESKKYIFATYQDESIYNRQDFLGSSGSKNIYFVVDYDNLIDESTEINNTFTKTISVLSSTTVQKPDLVITNAYLSPTPNKVGTYSGTLYLDVKNQGVTATNNSEGIKLEYSITKQDGTIIASNFKYIPNLKSGEVSSGISFALTNTNFNLDSIIIKVYIDNVGGSAGGFINESDETNNTFTKTVVINNASLVIYEDNNSINAQINNSVAHVYWATNKQVNCSVVYGETNALSPSKVSGFGELIQYAADTNDGRNHYYAKDINISNEKYYKILCVDDTGTTKESSVYAFTSYTQPQLKASTVNVSGDQSVVAGEQDKLFTNIILDATGSSEDIKVTRIDFIHQTSEAGIQEYLSGITLYDSVSNTALNTPQAGSQSNSTSANTTIILSNPLIIAKGTSKSLSLRADISGAAKNSTTHQFIINNNAGILAFSNTSNNVVKAEGNYPLKSALITISTTGTLKASNDSSNPATGTVLANATSKIGAFKLEALNENIKIQNIGFNISGSANTYHNLQWLQVFDGATKLGETAITGPSVIIATSGLTILKDSSKILTLKTVTSKVGSSEAGTSGEQIIVSINSIEAKGETSGSSAIIKTGLTDTKTNSQYIFKSIPVIKKVNLSSLLMNGVNDLYKFQITADQAGDIAWYKATFNFIKDGDFQISDITLSDELGNVLASKSGTFTGDKLELYLTDNPQIIMAGSTKIYVLTGNLFNFSSSSKNLIVKIVGDGGSVVSQSAVAAQASGNFIWSDLSLTPLNISSSAQWFNGVLIKTFDTQTTQVVPPLTQVTYSWSVGGWLSCANNSQTRAVICKDNNGATVADSFCSTTKPIANQSCVVSETKPQLNRYLARRLKGMLLLQVEQGGAIWYIDPINYQRHSATWENALSIFQKFALGVSNNDLLKIPVNINSVDPNLDTDGDGYSDIVELQNGYNPYGSGKVPVSLNIILASKLRGMFLLQTEQGGAIWYVDMDGVRHNVRWSNLADLFKDLALGITDNDLNKIEMGE